jgi:hypothetical protein
MIAGVGHCAFQVGGHLTDLKIARSEMYKKAWKIVSHNKFKNFFHFLNVNIYKNWFSMRNSKV